MGVGEAGFWEIRFVCAEGVRLGNVDWRMQILDHDPVLLIQQRQGAGGIRVALHCTAE